MFAKIEKKLDQFMEDTLFYQDLPGLAIGVKTGDGLRYKNAAGYKDFITKEKLKPEDVFHMASVTKLFVGTAIMQLWEKRRLQLSDKAVEILPWLSIDDIRYKKITIQDLLTHTAGLIDVSDYGWDRPELDSGALRRYVLSDEVKESKLLWDPGEEHFKYSNVGYEILGCVIAEVSGISFDDYVMEHILIPLGMRDSTLLTFERTGGSLDLEELSRAGLAMPHCKDAEKRIIKEPQYPYNRAHGPSSTLTSNIFDIEKWADAHLNKTILKPETYDLMWAEYAEVPNNGEKIGLSWFKRKQNGLTLYGHEGNDNGFRASFWICPKLGTHIIVCSNISNAGVKKIGKDVFDILTTL